MAASGTSLVLVAAVLMSSAAAMMTSAEEKSMMESMTLASAVKSVGGQIKDHNIQALIEAGLSRSHHGKGRLRSGAKTDAKNLDPTGYSGVEGAVAKLNEMILESEQKLDLEEIKCKMFDEEQRKIMEETRQDIATYNAIAAAARAAILQAMTQIEIIETKLPELQHVLDLTKAKCAEEIAALQAQLAIVEGDIEIMGIIIDMTQCNTASLLQCTHKKGKFFTLGHRALRTKLAQLKSATAREGIQKALAGVLGGSAQVPNGTAAGAMEVDTEPDPEKQLAKCTVADSPNCPLLRDRFIDIQSGIVDKRDELKHEIAQLQEECANSIANLMSQIADFEAKLKKAQTHLAESTEQLNDAMEQSRLKQEQLEKTYQEWMVEMARCKEAIFNLKTEICGLKKIRQEIMKLEGTSVFYQDCEVSDWATSECSVTCGGGTQQLTRTVIVQAVGGAACPPLSMDEECNTDVCPTDCELSYWSEYSDCSAKCGGGTQMRSRQILQEPLNGGLQCGATSENRECGVESCDKDCELNDWSGWSGCSKECGGGFQSRERTVLVPAEGQGACPTEDSELRLEWKECNEHECEPEGETLVCHSKLDVVILLDGSASLGQEGWDATLRAGELLVKAFPGGVNESQVGVLLFSGPSTYGQYYKCMDGEQDALEDCGISWVSHFTTDTEALAAQVAGLAWPAASTFTSMALATAEADLQQGRADASTIIIVVTDGRPLSTSRTFEAARDLREKARVMWVPVGPNCPMEDMESWASEPVHDNMIELTDFAALEDPESISAIIADACPQVS